MNIENTLISFIIGDALGVPAEFKPRFYLKSVPIIDMIGFQSHFQYPGTWSDDTSLTLCTLKSLIANNFELNYDDIMCNFIKWYKKSDFTASGYVFDIGNTTERSIKNYIINKDYKNCGLNNEQNNGNGSLMRMLPMVYYFIKNNDYELNDQNYEKIKILSSLTHAHVVSCMACTFYIYICLDLFKNKNLNNLENTINQVYNYFENKERLKDYLYFFNRISKIDEFKKSNIKNISSSGFVVDTLEASLYSLLTQNNLKDCLLFAVNLGDDTDTVAAITGSLAGFIYDYKNLPENWYNLLKNKDLILTLINETKEL